MPISHWSILSLLILFACNEAAPPANETSTLEDFLYHDNQKPVSYRSYKNMSDSDGAGILIKQIAHRVNDSVWEMEYLWMSFDSMPFNHSKERIVNGLSIEIMEQSFYEPDANDVLQEIEVEILGKRIFPIQNEMNVYKGKYQSTLDTGLQVYFETEFSGKFVESETYKSQIYQVNSSDITNLVYSQKEKNRTLHYASERIYVKGKGLVEFKQVHDAEMTIYRLQE